MLQSTSIGLGKPESVRPWRCALACQRSGNVFAVLNQNPGRVEIECAPRTRRQEATRMLKQSGFYLYKRAQYAEAESLFQSALAIYEKVFGAEHSEVAASLNNLAEIHR